MVSIDINMGHPCVLGGHGSKVEDGAETLKQLNIELVATLFCIYFYVFLNDKSI